MILLLTYAATLVVAVLVSERARRTVLSTAVLFLVAGAGLGVAQVKVTHGVVQGLADVALVTVLFTDAMRIPLPELRRAWRLPGRALLFGFPLSVAATAVAAVALVGLSWPEALLVGAALAPTDPVFASAIVGREEVPARLRNLLNVESGLNDGLALPFVVAFLALAGHRQVELGTIGWELVLGVALGIAVPWVVVRLERLAVFGASAPYRPIGVFGVGLLVFAIASVTRVNEFLAAFAAGTTLATVAPRAQATFEAVGHFASEILKLAALLVFGAMLSPHFLEGLTWEVWVFGLVTLLVVRPVSIAVALAGSALTRREKVVAAWFGPKGFASVVYGLLIAGSGIERADLVFRVVAVATALSVVLHSSTDVPVARWFEQAPSDAAEA